MITKIISMYITLMSPILAGILNMMWCKSKILKNLSIPIDFNKNFIDGKRIFGSNKTWKGFVGYIVLNILTACIWGAICNVTKIEGLNFLYINHKNTIIYNVIIGALLGLAYAICELPNSFIKRRIGIVPGKTSNGIKKYFFVILDQADSVIGCVFVVSLIYKISLAMFAVYVLLGTITHILINIMLYFMKLRKNMF